MTDFVTLTQIVLVLAAMAAPIAVAIRLLAGDDHQLASTAAGPFPRARGVQEEDDPLPWRIRPALG